MFLKSYGLETNPFDSQLTRPFFHSAGAREVATKLRRVASGQTQCLVISGAPHVGKTTSIRRALDDFDLWTVTWMERPGETRRDFLARLLDSLGLGNVDAEIAEMRKIIDVFLCHQAARKGPRLLVVDNLANEAATTLLSELRWLSGLRLRGRPLVAMVLVTPGEELLASLVPAADCRAGETHQHQVLSGFSLDETRDYIATCLQDAGNDDALRLVPDAVVELIQGYTAGAPGTIDRLCAAAFDAVAEHSANAERARPLSKVVVKKAADMLQLRYQETALLQREAPLSPEHVHQHNQVELRAGVARLLVSSNHQIVTEVSLNRPRIVLGRDPCCDISVNSRHVGRYQSLFLHTDEGWVMIDLDTTQGSLVNGRQAREHLLADGDVIALGSHELRFLDHSPPVRMTDSRGPDRSGSSRLGEPRGGSRRLRLS